LKDSIKTNLQTTMDAENLKDSIKTNLQTTVEVDNLKDSIKTNLQTTMDAENLKDSIKTNLQNLNNKNIDILKNDIQNNLLNIQKEQQNHVYVENLKDTIENNLIIYGLKNAIQNKLQHIVNIKKISSPYVNKIIHTELENAKNIDNLKNAIQNKLISKIEKSKKIEKLKEICDNLKENFKLTGDEKKTLEKCIKNIEKKNIQNIQNLKELIIKKLNSAKTIVNNISPPPKENEYTVLPPPPPTLEEEKIINLSDKTTNLKNVIQTELQKQVNDIDIEKNIDYFKNTIKNGLSGTTEKVLKEIDQTENDDKINLLKTSIQNQLSDYINIYESPQNSKRKEENINKLQQNIRNGLNKLLLEKEKIYENNNQIDFLRGFILSELNNIKNDVKQQVNNSKENEQTKLLKQNIIDNLRVLSLKSINNYKINNSINILTNEINAFQKLIELIDTNKILCKNNTNNKNNEIIPNFIYKIKYIFKKRNIYLKILKYIEKYNIVLQIYKENFDDINNENNKNINQYSKTIENKQINNDYCIKFVNVLSKINTVYLDNETIEILEKFLDNFNQTVNFTNTEKYLNLFEIVNNKIQFLDKFFYLNSLVLSNKNEHFNKFKNVINNEIQNINNTYTEYINKKLNDINEIKKKLNYKNTKTEYEKLLIKLTDKLIDKYNFTYDNDNDNDNDNNIHFLKSIDEIKSIDEQISIFEKELIYLKILIIFKTIYVKNTSDGGVFNEYYFMNDIGKLINYLKKSNKNNKYIQNTIDDVNFKKNIIVVLVNITQILKLNFISFDNLKIIDKQMQNILEYFKIQRNNVINNFNYSSIKQSNNDKKISKIDKLINESKTNISNLLSSYNNQELNTGTITPGTPRTPRTPISAWEN
jgi:hypothetical protein